MIENNVTENAFITDFVFQKGEGALICNKYCLYQTILLIYYDLLYIFITILFILGIN